MPPEKPNHDDTHTWEAGWDGHELEQMRRLARLSLPEKLAWLEEAHRLVLQMAAAVPARHRPGSLEKTKNHR